MRHLIVTDKWEYETVQTKNGLEVFIYKNNFLEHDEGFFQGSAEAVNFIIEYFFEKVVIV